MIKKWLYKGAPLEEIPKNTYGFIYLISNLISSKKYIGKKKFTSVRRIKQKNRKNRKSVIKESNWKEYMSSCVPLLEDIQKHGIEQFKFEILGLAESKGQLNYLEHYYQFKYNVLASKLPNGEKEYFNDCIASGKFRTLKLTSNFLEQIGSIPINSL